MRHLPPAAMHRRPLKLASFVVVLAAVAGLSTAVAMSVARTPAGAAATARLPAGEVPNSAETITADRLRAYLSFVAADEMEGRATPSRGLRITAMFLATHLSRWGLTPAGDDGTFFQQIEMRRTSIDPEATGAALGDRTFRFGDDFLAVGVAGSASGALVYASHGWVIEERGIDPYAGLDIEGKIVVISGSLPAGMTFRDLRSGRPGVDWIQPAAYAVQNGAAGLVVLPGRNDLERWERAARRAVERGSVEVTAFARPREPELPSITPSVGMADALFQGEAVSGRGLLEAIAAGDPGAPFELAADKSFSFNVEQRQEVDFTQNVVAILEGSHPERRSEHVAIGAHYDHVGIGNPINGDAIYNGADDDGSGTVSVLAIAEAFAKGPRPERSMLFVWHAGEESGLLGSRYVTEYPPVPLDSVVAQLNIDMVGRSRAPGDTSEANQDLTGPDEVYLIGPNIQSDELGVIVDEVNAEMYGLTINARYDDVDDPSRFFFRSDHFNYARNGIPIAFFFTGVHEDYHRPSDHPDKIDYAKLEKIARTIYGVAWELGNKQGRPGLNPDLPPQLRRQ